ncbi:phytanoyl-CoA dioxygenase family protein [Phenylobacterium sp.]|uniref:phytanoyl-CoA dioxygenase family protein n=1 Tax=Phenylobacterium sp. TaxID=1871053 RepID=UPI0025D041B5|nr:phytanoyl-CoA dioxygenase family protein [Phenylobacterium sp.]
MSAPGELDPYAVPDDLAARIDALDLRRNIVELIDEGYTVIRDPKAIAIADEVREAIIRCVPAKPEAKAPTRFTLLDQEPVFATAVTTPKLLALVEFLLGRGALFSQLSGSRRRPGPQALGLHADNSWFPAPFPEWEIMCTGCFVTDEFTEESGATLVIPGTHKLKDHPPKMTRENLEGAVPIVAPKGSICLWNGSVWHGNYPRQLPGERVVLHMTYTRLGMQPIETYDHLDDAWFEGKDPSLPRLLGRHNFLGRRHGWKQNDRELLKKTYDDVHGPSFRV